MRKILRVAYFADSFLEVNGVAMTSRRFAAHAEKNRYPLLCVHAAAKTETSENGSVSYLALKRSPLAVPMDNGLKYDPFFFRHANRIQRELVEFKPDLLHITGLNDLSNLGAYLGWKLQIPLVGSWHTNLHEYAAHRLTGLFSFLPEKTLASMTSFVERKIFDWATFYYRIPKLVLSPNQELMDALARRTKRESRLMARGVDTEIFSPEKRTVNDGIFRFGFVGRLRVEKNVRLLVELEKALIEKGKTDFKFLIVGEGSERARLEENLKHGEFTGFLDGEQLAEAYANMDAFVFPSETETFGNVVQEANASGVPVIVTDQGGPKFIVDHGATGFIAGNFDEFVKFSLELMDNPQKLSEMKELSRRHSFARSWDAVFESVYDAYEKALEIAEEQKSRKLVLDAEV